MTEPTDKDAKRLTVHNASVTTATVEIKTLAVSGKQVTLAVFRQLIEESILDRITAEVTGNAWGRVNYHPDKCADDPEHMHVVWQKGGELRRATIQHPEAGYHKHPFADLYVQARMVHGTVHEGHANPAPGDGLRLSESIPGGWRMFGYGRFTHDDMKFRGDVPKQLYLAWQAGQRPTSKDREAFAKNAWLHGVDGGASPNVGEHLLSRLPTAQHRQSWAELAELPQLFIAV